MYSSIIEIDNILISSDIVSECFVCDYEKCKGACCIIGDSGAPVKEEETEKLEANYPHYQDLMTPAGKARIDEVGFFEVDNDGDIVTPLIGNSEECAYTFFENGNCFCAIERAFCNGECNWRKPISCRLYPIRVSTMSNGMIALNLHRWDICKCAFEKGKKEGVPVYKFLKDTLIEHFGEEFYSALDSAAALINSSARS